MDQEMRPRTKEGTGASSGRRTSTPSAAEAGRDCHRWRTVATLGLLRTQPDLEAREQRENRLCRVSSVDHQHTECGWYELEKSE